MICRNGLAPLHNSSEDYGLSENGQISHNQTYFFSKINYLQEVFSV